MSLREGSSEGAELVAHLGHELRAPLAIVVGYAELLRRRDDPELREEGTQRILQAAERLTATIDDVLVVFAAKTGALTFEPDRLLLDAAVDEAVDVVRKRNGVRCTFGVQRDEAGPVEVHADEEYLTRIAIQLLANAAQRAPDESVVRISVRRAPPFGEVAVADTGPQVDDVEAAFERTRGVRSDQVEWGTGLELYAVRCLVEAQGGRVQAASSPAGAVFSAALPLAVP